MAEALAFADTRDRRRALHRKAHLVLVTLEPAGRP